MITKRKLYFILKINFKIINMKWVIERCLCFKNNKKQNLQSIKKIIHKKTK